MEYLIDEIIKYNSSDGTLFCPENNIDMITLNRVTNDLLSLLIKNAGVPVSRENLLIELWEKKGLNASGNNLNHYVSLLRKALAQCGCSDAISTIPKHGFIFNAPVISIDASLSSAHFKAKPEDIQPEPSIATFESEEDNKSSFSTQKLILAVAAILLIGSFLIPFVAEKIRLSSVRSEVVRVNQCRFYVIDDLTRRLDKEWVVMRINRIITDQNINCALQANIYYSSDKKRNIAGAFVLHELLSYCAYGSKAPCENYIYIRKEDDYENKD